MPTYSVKTHLVIFLLTSWLLAGCSGTRPDSIGVKNGKLVQCPASPNCVSSDSTDEAQFVPAIIISTSPEVAWHGVKEYLHSQENFSIITETSHYFHVECASTFFGFIDDFEIYLQPRDGIIAVRSASRLGYSDFGVNRNRIAHFRQYLLANNLINMD